MRDLQDILYKVDLVELSGQLNKTINKISFDSRDIEKNDVFVAVKGVHVDGHEYIQKAIGLGANVIVCEVIPSDKNEEVTYVLVKDSTQALAYMAANYYDNPSDLINLVGITGTNGKTTTTTLLYELFMGMGTKTGLISTVVNKIGEEEIPATHTTPNPIELNRLLRKMVDEGCEYCFMEVSSHAIVQNRVLGVNFNIGVFSNITHDHLDYHKTFKEYIHAKKLFFDHLSKHAIALTNIDDKNGAVMVQNTSAKVKTYALKSMADYKAKIIENSLSGLVLNINNHEVWTKLVGDFNAYNILVVYAVAMEFELDEVEVLRVLSQLASVEGRFEQFISDSKVIGIVDYAHTPDALKNVLETITKIRTRNEQVITLVGCGGDRDTAKRPVMAEIATEFSDKVILTSDNPRTENPDEIIREMQAGVPAEKSGKTLSITSREEAIKVACSLAQPNDIILIAGKGHEKYQDINGVKHPFDDLEILKSTLKILNK